MQPVLTYNVLFWAASLSGLYTISEVIQAPGMPGSPVAIAQSRDATVDQGATSIGQQEGAAQTDPNQGIRADSNPQPSGMMTADSPFSDYMARATAFVLIAGFLVVFGMGGILLAVNLGLMSKREEDRVGERTPSELGFVTSERGISSMRQRRLLPALEDVDQPVTEDMEHTRVGEPDDQSITMLGVPVIEMKRRQRERLEDEKLAS